MWRLFSLLLICSQPFFAHTISLTYADVAIDNRTVRWSLKLPVPEMDLLLGLDSNHDGKVDVAEVRQAQQRIQAYVLSKLGVSDQGREVSGSMTVAGLWQDPEGHPFIQAEAVFSMPDERPEHWILHCDLLRDVVSTHRTLAKITTASETREFVFEQGRNYRVESGPSTLQSFLQFLRMGILHIFTGYDHIAFLLGVVLIGGSFKTLVKVVTSFTVAHSITLALAALHIVELPSRLVESGIALSIMYIALENLLFQKFDRRWIITFLFGLIHGFGFASALEEAHLTRQLLATALFSFNLGVEVGQLCIVGLMLPALLYIGRLRFNTAIVKACSAVIFVLGSVWLWQRIH